MLKRVQHDNAVRTIITHNFKIRKGRNDRCHAELILSEAEVQHLISYFFKLHYENLFSTFCLDTKSGAKKSRQTQMPPAVLPASAQQPL